MPCHFKPSAAPLDPTYQQESGSEERLKEDDRDLDIDRTQLFLITHPCIFPASYALLAIRAGEHMDTSIMHDGSAREPYQDGYICRNPKACCLITGKPFTMPQDSYMLHR